MPALTGTGNVRMGYNVYRNETYCGKKLPCRQIDRVCDGYTDCIDKSDEDPIMCAQRNCSYRYLKCKDGQQCIEKEMVCDGGGMYNVIWSSQRAGVKPSEYTPPDCHDKSDEDPAMCAKWDCQKNRYDVLQNSFIKCADDLQCINDSTICDGFVHCKDRSDELCDDSCNKERGMGMRKSIMKRCPEDTSVCIPVHQYCDGIAQCPDAGDELQAHCTCEDWGLLSCKEEVPIRTKCLNAHWDPAGTLNETRCQDFLSRIYMYFLKDPVKENKGMSVLLQLKRLSVDTPSRDVPSLSVFLPKCH